jgi:hypothetical protein
VTSTAPASSCSGVPGQLSAEQTAVALTRRTYNVEPAVLRRHSGWRQAVDAR